ncbi:hypothetical protein VTK73DRAFT_1863 [Phialemonium thermophilum]|uniref:Nonsense-mediated mRNA decay factor n=1 Tax=Phialemonium thermophilum TaxID=223376 RepID=A0ABR3X7U3_9PEZI
MVSTTASSAWAAAQKTRRVLLKKMEQIKNMSVGEKDGSILDRLENLEQFMAEYRLACVETLWLDVKYAAEEKVEATMWQMHISVNSTYRKVLGKLTGSQHVVARRKVEKLYATYLKTAQSFYKGYVQRLCARYSVPQMQRIARRAKLEMEIPDKDRVDAAATGVQPIVLASCHITLTYLGDLSRYRTLLRPQNDRKFDTALAYYSIANDLVPESGYGHHQMGLIFLGEKKHADIVYHFYRALAAPEPHPNALGNLEVEFRNLLRPAQSRAQTPHEAFTSWFVRLHAHYYQGQEFNQRSELEEEVLHRLKMALKDNDFGETLLKTVLVNICAYEVAQERVKAKWTAEGSQSCQFILGFNVRTIHAIARSLDTEVRESIAKRAEPDEPGGASASLQDETGKFTPSIAAALPVFRVYMAWLCKYRSHVVQFQAHLEPHIRDMYKATSLALTGLFELVGDTIAVSKRVRYLLPEDVETLGLPCLNSPDLPVVCRLSFDPVEGVPKPRREDLNDVEAKPEDVAFTRCLDILSCAIILASDDTFPFTTGKTDWESGVLAEIIFLEEGKPPSLVGAAVPGPVGSAGPAGDLASRLNSLQPMSSTKSVGVMSCSTSSDLVGHSGISRSPSGVAPAAQQMDPPSRHYPPVSAPSGAVESDTSMENRLFELLDDFLAPPESHKQRTSPEVRQESSYGMHSGTAQDVFQSAAAAHPPASPEPASGPKKSFPTLPWNYFYTPSDHNPGPQAAARHRSWQSASARSSDGAGAAPTHVPKLPGFEGLEDPFARVEGTSVNSQANQGFAGLPTSGIWSPPAGLDVRGNTYAQAPVPSPGQYGPAAGKASPFSTFAFSADASSLPMVNSPYGLPNAPSLTGVSANQLGPYSATTSSAGPVGQLGMSSYMSYDAATAYSHGYPAEDYGRISATETVRVPEVANPAADFQPYGQTHPVRRRQDRQ